MRTNRFLVGTTILFIVWMFHPLTLSAASATLQGTIRDAKTGNPLPSANVVLVGTSLGSASDIEGRYLIRNVPPGSFTLRASYVGYRPIEIPLDVGADEIIVRDFALEPVALEGEEVLITAQARGQKVAINEQLAANTISSVVSAARIQELPDANAAEAVARLPGVSILRSGGEGNQVVIRGLQPKYNAILVDGVRMASSHPSDRSTDLSMISPYSLEAIEVIKTVTPDQDPDVLGGTVNFKLRHPRGEEQGLGIHLLAQGGYNGLANAPNKFNNYKYVASVEGRFLKTRLGLFAQADLERRNLTSNELGASYDHIGTSTTEYRITSLNLSHIPRDRQRYNGTLVLDYRLPRGTIALTNFLSSGTTDVQNRRESFDIQGNLHLYSLAYSRSTLNLITNALSLEHQLPVFHADFKLSHTYSETKSPEDWTVTFLQTSAGIGQFFNVPNLNPEDIPKAANNNLAATFLNSCINNSSFSRERAFTASGDLDAPISFSDLVTSTIKFGGKYRHQTRAYDYEHFNNNASFASPSARIAAQLIASHFPATTQYDPTALPIAPFSDRDFSYGDFLGGKYPMSAPLNFGMMAQLARLLRDNAEYIAQQQAEGYARNNLLSITNDYSGKEQQTAAYAMATINVGPRITIIPGIRYQRLTTTYDGSRGIQSSLSHYAYNHYDTTVTLRHSRWLPSVHLRFKPLSWIDVRLSYTNTIAYPDYSAIIPRIDVATTSIAWNNYKLVPSRSRNYDGSLAFFSNTIGLFTISGFLKQIDDLIYPWTFFVSGADAAPYFPPSITAAPPSGNFSITTFVNNTYRIDNWGLELDWQTHFWYLPNPLKGLVLNVNYTHIFSRAQYPFVYLYRASLRSPIQYIDTSYTDRLLYQPDNLVNISVGYDFKDFSIRASMLYQTDIFTGPNFWPQLRSSTSAYRRWDISARQILPWLGLQLYGDISNLDGANDINVIQGGGVPRAEQSYGMTATVGLRLQF